MKEDSEDVYALTKRELAKVVKKHYQKAKEKHNESVKKGRATKRYNCFIDKNGVYNAILQAKYEADIKLLEKYKNRNLKEAFMKA
ncbi:hypothetical protein GX831_04200 [bacterium]|nr:hypothetical protein [bacterium]